MNQVNADYLFISCQIGAEGALKKEIARRYPAFHFSFSKPGFVTFKNTDPQQLVTPDFTLELVFARAFGKSVARLDQRQQAVENFGAEAVRAALKIRATEGKRLRLHVWERDQYKPGEEPPGFEAGKQADEARERIEAEAERLDRNLFLGGERAEPGDLVFDVVVLSPEMWWLGIHRHGPTHSPYPGGKPKIEFPEEAPSRAYVKLEEALLWSGAPVRSGDTAVEVGSAPGGATYALLRRGLRVVGIDPGEMDPIISRRFGKEFRHIQKPVAGVLREELPEQVHWLLLDMNVSPQVSLFAVDRLAVRMKDSLLGLLLTVKMNQWELADQIPSMLEHVKAMGMSRVRATQLSSNKQEIFIYALTRRGLGRYNRP